MQPETTATTGTPKAMLWTGHALSGLIGALFLFAGAMTMTKPAEVVKNMTSNFGYPESSIVPIGLALTVSTVLYLIPRTAVLGAILLTGYLGGAVATHVHHQDSVGEMVAPIIAATIVWLGLVLRDARLRALTPWRTAP